MSKPEEKEKRQKMPTTEELLAEVVQATKANQQSIQTMAEAIVKLNEKIEAQGSGKKSGGSDALSIIEKLVNPKSGGLEQFASQARAFAQAADAIEHFRRPSRLGVGEALLMRLGVRAAYPRYMTKTELEKLEKRAGVWEVLEGEETGHVSE